MTARESLLAKAREYELRAIAADDQAVAGDASARVNAASWTTVAIVLREVAAALDEEREAA